MKKLTILACIVFLLCTLISCKSADDKSKTPNNTSKQDSSLQSSGQSSSNQGSDETSNNGTSDENGLSGGDGSSENSETMVTQDNITSVENWNGTSDSSQNSSNADVQELLELILDRGKSGMLMNVDFVVGSYEYPKDVLGDDYVLEEGLYLIYDELDAVFDQKGRGNYVYEARSFSPKLSAIKRSDVEAMLGEYDYIAQTDYDEIVLGYILNDDYRIKFVFDSESTVLDHYNLFKPEAMTNSMSGHGPQLW